MSRDRLIKLLIHPFAIGLVVSIPVLILTLPEIPRYRATVEDTRLHSARTSIIYDDLDQDGLSEEINVDRNPQQLKIMLFSGPRLIEQYNLKPVPPGGFYTETGDFDHDGLKELYLLTMAGDSILLTILNPFAGQDYLVHERLIFYQDTIEYNLDIPFIRYGGLSDLTGDGFSELVFFVTSGYSLRPRTVYIYDIITDSLRCSPPGAATIRACAFCDLDGDSVPEVLLNTDATGNYDTNYPYLDHSSWLMVLNGDADFRFPPVEFRGYPSRLITRCFQQNDSTFLAVLHDYYGNEPLKSGLYIYDSEGVQRAARELEVSGRGTLNIYPGIRNMQTVIRLLDPEKSTVTELNTDLDIQDVKDIPPLYDGMLAGHLDLDRDGEMEEIYWGKERGELVIFRKNFNHPVILKFQENAYPGFIGDFSDRESNQFYLDFAEKGYFVQYGVNGWYYFKFPLASALYVSVSLLIMLIYRVQRYRAERQYQTQRRISELQILSLKNQIDPHFTFNILNSLGHLYTNSDLKERSYDLFVKYSRLLRKSVENSDRISVSLREELDFVRTYVELEQLRSHPPFRYNLAVGEEVDQDRAIPRMLIHTFVENSIKHGIHQRHSETPGELGIRISSANGQTTIVITDNGPGLNAEALPSSTGKGLKIIDELIGLFDSLEGVKINYTMEERVSADGSVEGMEVRIHL